ncbi:MAG: restriction endonuclease subunit S, partial [Nitrospirota bacterium]|nr:restriction endonuclease subunit S [Nitrospirota bacterium]
QTELQQTTVGMGVPHVSGHSLGQMLFSIPSPAEQRRIARYLDEATEKVDRLVTLRRRQMELLREQRTALIQEAVTRGLNPNALLKDSGISELGEIPTHWNCLRIAVAVSKVSNGYVGPTRDILQDEGVRYIQSLHVKDGFIIFDTPYYVSKEWSDNHPRSILKAGDVLIVQTGACTGQFALVPEEFEGTNCHALIIVRMKPVHGSGRYLSLLLSSSYGQTCLMRERTGALHPHLECGKVRDIRLPFPPPEEQNDILDFIQNENTRIDALHDAYTRQLELLTEYRAALVRECVTGQRAVP